MPFGSWYILIFLLHFFRSSTTARIKLIEWSIETTSPTLPILDKWLSLPMQDIPHLRLLLRYTFLRQDAENVYFRWFLEHSPSMITIATYNESSRRILPFLGVQRRRSNRLSYAIVTSMEQLQNAAQRFLQRAGNFFFILSDSVNKDMLRDVLQSAWMDYNVFKMFILTKAHGILIFDPFQYDHKHMRYGEITKYTGEELLERLLFKDMRGYPMRVQIFRSVYARPQFDTITGKVNGVAGVDGEVARALRQHMNFSLILQDPDPNYFGERDANGTFNGAIGSLIRNEIDLCLNGFFVKDYRAPEMAFTVAVYDDQLCIYVPKASRVPQSIIPLFAVSLNVWASYILTAFGCATAWWLFRQLNLWLHIRAIKRSVVHLHLRKNRWFQLTRIHIDTWVVWVRCNIVRYPPFNSERVFLASLCLVSVIFGAIFESSLATVYIHPLYYKDINTLRELDESDLKIIYKYSSMADDLFFSETSLLYANLNKKLTHLQDLNADVLVDIATNGGKAGVTRYTSLMLESMQYLVTKRIWVVPECPKYYTMSYVLPKDSPWEEGINQLLLRFLNAGLINKWISDMEAEVDRKIMKEQIFESNDEFKILTVADLQLAFYVIIFGSSVATLSFIFENILQRFLNC